MDRPNDHVQREFEAFHAANPHVYAKLVELARAYQSRGMKAGIGHLWEVMRWQMTFSTSDVEFKLNNNHRSRYARLIMANEFGLEKFFDTRALTASDQFTLKIY